MGSQQKSSLLLLALMMIISLAFVQKLQAIPISRTLNLANQKNQIVQEEKWNWNLEADEAFFHGRSDIESQDYPGSGANHSHEPGGGSKSPGKP